MASLREVGDAGRDPVQHTVGEPTWERCVGVVTDQRELRPIGAPLHSRCGGLPESPPYFLSIRPEGPKAGLVTRKLPSLRLMGQGRGPER